MKENLPTEGRTGFYTGSHSGGDKSLLAQYTEKVNTIWENVSKVVDENGEPLVVYHGSPHYGFTVFDKARRGERDKGDFGRGFYFTPNRGYAATYGKEGYWNAEGDDSKVYACFLNIREPMQVQARQAENMERWRFGDAEGVMVYTDKFYDLAWNDVKNLSEIVVHESNQIKSATDNRGTFDGSSPDITFSIRTKPAPKKTGVGYKVFYQRDGKLYPPMVANPGGEDTPVGVWLDADEGVRAGTSKTGRPQVKAGGKGTQGGSGTLAYRPGWHLGKIPYALQFNRKNPVTGERDLFPADFVWAEVEYAADENYQEEAMKHGLNKNGRFQHSLAGLPRIPEDGYYEYRTNPDPRTDPWIITGAMKVNRVLSKAEVDELVRAAGREPQQVQLRRDWTAAERAARPFNSTLEYPGEALVSFSVSDTLMEDIRRAAYNKIDSREHIHLCTMPTVMRMMGEPDGDVYTLPGTISKLVYTHNLAHPEVYRAVEELDDPLFVFKDTANSYLFVLEMQATNNKGVKSNVAVAIQVKRSESGHYLLSAYPLDALDKIVSQYEQKHLVYSKYTDSELNALLNKQATPPTDGASVFFQSALVRSAVKGGLTPTVKTKSDLVKYKVRDAGDFSSSLVNMDEESVAREVVDAGQGFRANLAYSEAIMREMRGAMQRLRRLGSKTRTDREDAVAAMGTMVQMVKAAVAVLPKGYRAPVASSAH